MTLSTQARSSVIVGEILLLSLVIENGISHRIEREVCDSASSIECILNRGRLKIP